MCEQLKLVTCDNMPCKNGGNCFNVPGKRNQIYNIINKCFKQQFDLR